MKEFFPEPNTHRSIRRYSSLLGWMFSSVKLERGSGDNVQIVNVPCMVSGEMAYARSDRVRNNDLPKIRTTIPRSAIRFNGVSRDTMRTTTPQDKLYLDRQKAAQMGVAGSISQDARAATIFNFDAIYKLSSRNEAYQLIELFSTRFNPYVSVEIVDNKDIGIRQAVQIDLLDIGYDDDWEGDFESTRDIIVTFSFAVKGFMYSPSSEVGLIEKVICGLDINGVQTADWVVVEE